MFDLTQEAVDRDYERLKRLAATLSRRSRLDAALRCIGAAAHIAYHLNSRLADDELEDIVASIASAACPPASFEPIKGRIVFYDYFGISQRGLTQQYLQAIGSWGGEFLYILESSGLNDEQEILDALAMIPGARVRIIERDLAPIKKVVTIVEAVTEFRPEIALLHLAPWSAVAVAAWQRLASATRYYINITDHAFLLGKCCSDRFIEFRPFGVDVTITRKQVAAERVRMLSNYPILIERDASPLAIDLADKIVIFSGGALYKMYGDGDVFLGIIGRIVRENPRVVILLAGDGDAQPIQRFIDDNAFHERIYLIGNRKDLCHIFRRCDLYLNTYPLSGALMCQLAAAYGKPAVGYTGAFGSGNRIEPLLEQAEGLNLSFDDLEALHAEINTLIDDTEYRHQQGEALRTRVKSPAAFAGDLRILLDGGGTLPRVPNGADWRRVARMYLEVENRYLRIYDRIKFSHLRGGYFALDAVSAVTSALRWLFRNPSSLRALVARR